MEFPAIVWMVLGGTLLTRTAFFMVWPFLAIILARDFELSSSAIGSILGSAFLASGVVGFYAGNLSDRLGRRIVMIGGCIGAVGAYVVLATAQGVAAYAIGAFLVGLTRAAIESPGAAVIGDQLGDESRRHFAMHLRYFFINLGGAVGPLLGLVLGLAARQLTFWIAVGAYMVYAVALNIAYTRSAEPPRPSGTAHASLRAAADVLCRDRRFMLLVAANFLTIAAYAQHESTLIQHVSRAQGGRSLGLVTALVATNAVVVIALQFPLLAMFRRYDLFVRTYVGLILFAAAFVAYAFLPTSVMLPWIVATGVLSAGEAVLFPSLQLQTDRLAPAHLRGSYFGAAALGGLGFGVGPAIGGFLLEGFGGRATFLATAASLVACGGCYWLSSRQPTA